MTASSGNGLIPPIVGGMEEEMEMDDKRIQAGNEGEELVPGETENLSSFLHNEGKASRPDASTGRKDEPSKERDKFDRREEELGDRPR